MKAFCALYQALDRTASNRQKIEHIGRYLSQVSDEDAAWAVFFLAGGKIRRLLPMRDLRQYALDKTGLPAWLFEESYQAVGDLAETIALLLPKDIEHRDESLSDWISQGLLPLQALSGQARLTQLDQAVDGWSSEIRFLALKLITSGFRVGVSRSLVTQALAAWTGLTSVQMAQRMVGYLSADARPCAQRWSALIATSDQALEALQPGQPYPFFLAHPLTPEMLVQQALGPVDDWQFEWKWDGIRAQWVKRKGQVWLWSRGEDWLSAQFPELQELPLPDGTVLDGELLVWQPGSPLPESFAALQKRLGRKQVSSSMCQTYPVTFMVYDLLQWQGMDQRSASLQTRRERLDQVFKAYPHPSLRLSIPLSMSHWSEAAQHQQMAREYRAEGLMLKARDSSYGVGRTRSAGLWFKWKLDPMTIDAVVIYAQRGHGRRANLYTDYTFAVWDGPPEKADRTLIPIAKAYSGLSDREIRQVDAILKKSTLQSFGPVRQVEPTLVFELGFEGIALSPRHKSGVALRFPRMLRWRTDKPIHEADTLQTVQALIS